MEIQNFTGVCILHADEMQSCRAESANRSCTFGGENASERQCVGTDGNSKRRTGIQLFTRLLCLRKKKPRGNHFWQRGYFVDSVGANDEIIRRYVRLQNKVTREEDQRQLMLGIES